MAMQCDVFNGSFERSLKRAKSVSKHKYKWTLWNAIDFPLQSDRISDA